MRESCSCTIVNLHENIVEVAEYSTVNVHGKSVSYVNRVNGWRKISRELCR
jgi:hypothetical protein